MFRLLSVTLTAAMASFSLLAAPGSVRIADEQEIPPQSASAMPARETELLGFFAQARKELAAARSDDAREAARIGLQIKIAAFMRQSQLAENWQGTVLNNGRTPEGDYWITIEIEPGATIFTPRNRQADREGLMLIKPWSPLAPVVKALQIGQPVTFTAKVFGLEVTDDRDTITHPQFYGQFTALKPKAETQPVPHRQ